MRTLPVLIFVGVLAWPGPAVADTSSLYYFSLEWLVDASDTIVEATVVPSKYTGNPLDSTITVKSVERVLKQVGPAGPAEGCVLPAHVAGGKKHQVLLFLRSAEKKPEERVVYCIFLTPDPGPEDKKADPFGRLPYQTSSGLRISFHDPRCSAIDRTGKVLTEPKSILKRVEERVKEDPKRLSAKGKNIKSGPKEDDGDDHNLMVPEEPKGK